MRKLYLLILLLFFSACNSSDIEEAIDLIEGVDRKPIDVSRMGINAFGNKPAFGTACAQYRDIKDNLGLKYVRILINWNDGVQPSPNSGINFSFYDDLLDCIPNGVKALLVVNGLPSWMSDSANWQDANPRTTFVQRWFRRVVRRYHTRGKVLGFQVWNEPNMKSNNENNILEVAESSANYLEMQALAYSVAKDIDSSKLILNAATTSINQNFRDTLNYNKQLREMGIESFVDRYAIHYYGEQFERLVLSNGVAEFLNLLTKPIWITETGEQGFNDQLAYVETVWPFLREKVPSIDLIFYYQYASNAPADTAYGLRNTSSETPVSDLYVYLTGSN